MAAPSYPKMTNWLVALIWVSFAAVVIATFLANITTNYNIAYNESNVTTYNKLAELNSSIKDYKDETESFEEDPSLTDVIGQYFSRGYSVMMLAMGSFDIMKSMLNDALSNSGIDTIAGMSLQTAIALTTLVMIVIGIIVTAIIKLRM